SRNEMTSEVSSVGRQVTAGEGEEGQEDASRADGREHGKVEEQQLAGGDVIRRVVELEDGHPLEVDPPGVLLKDWDHRDDPGDESGERDDRADHRRTPADVVDGR